MYGEYQACMGQRENRTTDAYWVFFWGSLPVTPLALSDVNFSWTRLPRR